MLCGLSFCFPVFLPQVGEIDTGNSALKGLCKRLKRCNAEIKTVVTVMAGGYMAGVPEHLPDADLVLGHLHLVK